jgi:hypothetical protein
MLILVGADCTGILSDWREPAMPNDATASSWPNAGIASTGTKLPETAKAETVAYVARAAVVKAVGVALGCAYNVALKPGNILVGKAILSFL